jgi:putative hydrolase of the HAD superfamily
MNKKIKAILFDADGIVIDSGHFSRIYTQKFNIKMEKMLPFFDGIFQDCKRGQADIKKELEPYLKEWKWEKGVEEFLNFWFEIENNIITEGIEIIEYLKMRGVKCYLVTDQEINRTNFIRNEMGLKNIFDNIYSSAEIGYLKSEPEFYQYVLNDLGFEKREILFIDDRQKNIDIAKKIGLNNSYLANNSDEVKEILKNMKIN